jgi:hypothetical protein
MPTPKSRSHVIVGDQTGDPAAHVACNANCTNNQIVWIHYYMSGRHFLRKEELERFERASYAVTVKAYI